MAALVEHRGVEEGQALRQGHGKGMENQDATKERHVGGRGHLEAE